VILDGDSAMFARVTTVAFEGIEGRAVDAQIQIGPPHAPRRAHAGRSRRRGRRRAHPYRRSLELSRRDAAPGAGRGV